MQDLVIQPTKSSPEVVFIAADGRLSLRGESYPEHAVKFYEPVLQWISSYLATESAPLQLTMDIVYFNSSSSKILMNLFDMLEDAAADGKDVHVVWRYHEENEIAEECGEEFKEETQFLRFELQSYGDKG
ncbi:DUF1987 domain-containing protein [Desulfovibrio inopinatus]|uniref:DUF1987 domain-containing protein n=1 Tax=Desulfovibrio inopinatus TaxID=102109 RepID=UPI00040B096E|nr:DUF1987 domain-containing protein [Desulfovibrio inopinatus]